MADNTSPQYVRQTGTTDVYNTVTGKYVNYADAQAGNIWGQVKDVSNIADYGVKATNLNTLTGVDPGVGKSSANDASNFSLTAPNAQGYNPGKTMDLIAAQSAGWQSQIDTMNANQAELLKQRQALQTDTVGLLNQQNQAFGVNDMLGQIKSLTAEANAARDNLNAIQAEANNAQLNVENRRISLESMTREQAMIQKRYDSRIAGASATLSAKGLQIEALRGNLSMAKTFADQMVSALTYDAQQKVANLDFVFNYNQDLIKELGSKITEGFKTQMALAQTQYDEQKADRMAVANLMIQYGMAGIQPTDTIEVASQKASKQAAIDQQLARQKEQAAINASNRSNAGTPSGISYYDDFAQEAINNNDTPLGAYQKTLAEYAATHNGETMPDKDANALYQRIIKMTKTSQPSPTTTTTPQTIFSPSNPLNISSPSPVGLQNTSLAGKDAGNGMVWTADGRIVTKAQYEKELKSNTPTYVVPGQTQDVFNSLFGTNSSKLTVK